MNNLATICSYITLKKKELPGKKAFQKIMYFITASGVPTGLKFSIYHYGPYSSELDYSTDNLQLMGAITIEETAYGYKIFPGDKSEAFVEKEKEWIEKYQERMDYLLEHLPEQPMALELWSTTHYVADMLKTIYEQTDEKEIVREVVRIKKDKFSEEQIREALHHLQQLGLIH
ncbi:hypothetical protein BSNK01_12900 [Bacillaceae bacterium]